MEKYDVVIIGAGIGGLVCGCYLAKAGLKVLIVEQHDKPGGCCTSFKRKGFTFDVGVHYIGSLREEGILYNILKDFDLLNRIKFITNDPTDRIITPDKTVFIRQDKEKTKEELVSHFPQEKENINNFFDFVLKSDFLSLVSKTKNKTFKELLDSFFTDYKLKAVLSILLGNLGLPPSQASALVSTILYIEYILDGGYYPKGGVQALPDLLTEKFKQYGGSLLLSTKVIEVITKNKKVKGIKLEKGNFIATEILVSNADATLTFCKLLDFESDEAKMVKELKTSPSAFIIYLGVNKDLNITPKHYTTWYFSTYNIEKCYALHKKPLEVSELDYVLATFSSSVEPALAPSGKSIIRIFLGAEYASKKVWDMHKDKLCNKAIEKASRIVSNFDKFIEVKEVATPATIERFTSNHKGALFGWAAIPSQISRNISPSKTSVDNLYLTGHWVTNGVGQASVSLVGLCGRNTAKAILRKINR